MPGRLENVNTTFMTDLFPIRVSAGDPLTADAAELLFTQRPRECINRVRGEGDRGLDPNTVAFFRPHIANGANGMLRVVLGAPIDARGIVTGAVPAGAKISVYAIYRSNYAALDGKAIPVGNKEADPVQDGLPMFLYHDIPAGCQLVVLCDKPATIFFSHTL